MSEDVTTIEAADAALVAGAPEPEAPAAEPAEQPTGDGQPRDEQGRFTATPKPEPEPSPEAAAQAPETPAEPVAEPETPVEYPPFQYRADGQEFSIPGSAVGEDGVFIPKDSVPELQQLLSSGKAASGSVRQRLNDAAQREQVAAKRAEAAEAQVAHILGHFENLIAQSQHVQDWAQSPFAQWGQQAAINWPVLQAEAKAAALEKQREADREALEKYQQQERQAQLRPVMDQTLDQSIRHFGTQAGLNESAIRELFQMLKDPRWESVVFPTAPYDDPATGIKQGERVIDHGFVQEWVQRAKTWARETPKPQAKAPVPPKQPAKAPPTVPAKGKAPAAGAKIPTFKSAKEADEWFERGGYNEIDLD